MTRRSFAAVGFVAAAVAAASVSAHATTTRNSAPVAAVTCYTVGPVTVADQQIVQAVTVCVPTP